MYFKKTVALLLAVGSFGLAAAAPLVTLEAIPSVTCVTPLRMTYQKRINSSGTIEALNIKEIYLETPVIAHSVNVSVGDIVRKDQVLAVIDTELSKSVAEQSIPASAFTGNQPTDQQTADLMGLYSALQSSAFAENIGSLDELAEVYGALGNSVSPPDNYIYIPETIIAPMDGVITEVGIKSDVLSRTAKPVMTISDTSSFVAMVTVGESFISDVEIGDKAIIKGTGFSDKEYKGHVRKIYPVARKSAGGLSQETVVDLEIAIDNPDAALKAGFTARAEILTNTKKNMLTVPYEAVQQDKDNVEYVYLIKDSKTVRRDIVTGVELLEGVEVVAGLEASDVLLANASAAGKEGVRINLQRG
ncbi:HlyD family efflux transporter periplasmic adaptor subunit [Oscillospiraceae bacterium PP1C4]